MKNTNLLSAMFAVGLLLATSNSAFALDTDGDGWDVLVDCNDNDVSVYPGAFEVVGNNVDEDCDGQETCYHDADNDGARSNASVASADLDCDDAFEARLSDPLDCNDGDSGTYPGAIEVVGDNIDQDCSGGEVCYLDTDDDGARTAATILSSDGDCFDATEAVAADPLDCDDSDAAVHPGAVEACDASDRDEDCSGAADDLDTAAVGKTSWYMDGDGDSYGAGVAELACDAPPSHVATFGDCDDSNAAISPGDPEICDSSAVDDDCDSFTDCDDTDCGSAPVCTSTVEVFDHLECFKIKTSEKLKAYADVDPGIRPPFALAAGCTIGKATKYCVPVMKTVAVVDASSTLTPDPDYVGQNLENDRICYRVKCPDTAAAAATVTVRDRFGNRQFTKLQSTEICTPAELVP